LVLLIFSLFAGVFVPEVAGLTPFNTGTKVSTLGMVGTIIVMAGLIIFILATIANKSARKIAKMNHNPNKIEKTPHGSFSYYILLILTAGYYDVYAEQIAVAKLNIMLRHKLVDKRASFPAAAYAVVWTGFLSPALFIGSFVLVNGILLNSAAHAAILNLDFTALGVIVGDTLTGFVAMVSNMAYIAPYIVAGWMISLLAVAFMAGKESNNVKNRLIALAQKYVNDDDDDDGRCSYIIEWYRRYDSNGIFGIDQRAKKNWVAFAELIRIHNDRA
jgi:hypothetical protein